MLDRVLLPHSINGGPQSAQRLGGHDLVANIAEYYREHQSQKQQKYFTKRSELCIRTLWL